MNDTAATSPATREPDSSRRRLIAALVGGGIATVAAPLLAGRAGAANVLKDPADNAALNAAYELETRLAATCEIAVAGLSSSADRAAIELIRDHHLGYAQAIKGSLGLAAVAPNTAPFSRPSGVFESVAREIAALEDSAVASHLATIPRLAGANAAALLTSIANVEARHSAALRMVSGTSAIAASK